MKRINIICPDIKKSTSRRILSIICIATAIALTGMSTACTSTTTDTTTTSAEAESMDSASVIITEDTALPAESTDNTTSEETTENTTTEETTDNTATEETTEDSTAASGATDNSTSTAVADTTSGISLEDAKAIALADAGLAETDVTYTKQKQDTDHGIAVYEIDFYTSTAEYDYEIQVSDGTILEKSTEAFHTDTSGTGSTSSDSYITTEEAKSIALGKAGLTAADVTFQKAMLERDDGIMVYEIEFYQGRTEYECTINAITGAILEYSTEID
ncbi:MAG: PepSY domain-containing protein [Clostridiales bacterium]|nr:PepSY domain-containing protein [Clostridiales bacterium]